MKKMGTLQDEENIGAPRASISFLFWVFFLMGVAKRSLRKGRCAFCVLGWVESNLFDGKPIPGCKEFDVGSTFLVI